MRPTAAAPIFPYPNHRTLADTVRLAAHGYTCELVVERGHGGECPLVMKAKELVKSPGSPPR